jgi:hypothetical protein
MQQATPALFRLAHACALLFCVGWLFVPQDPAKAEKFDCAQSEISPYVSHRRPDLNHIKYAPMMRGLVREFTAYVSQFDTDDDDDGDGVKDYRAIPEWIAYELKAVEPDADGHFAEPDVSITRPRNWYNEPLFSFLWENRAGITHTRLDDSYDGFGDDWNRGHLDMSDHAQRISAEAACDTHHFWNAVPQAADMNQGPWRHLENYTAAAANKFGAVWIIAGPIVDAGKPVFTIGRAGTVPVVVPNALYKIVIREAGDGTPEALGFIFEQKPLEVGGKIVPGLAWVNCNKHQHVYDHTPNLRPIREIEERTGLRFFASLPGPHHDAIVNAVPTALWTLESRFWDVQSTCAGQTWHPASAGPSR